MSFREFLKRNLPEHHKFREHHHLRHFGELLHDPDIWHLTRRSSAGGTALGLFCAFIPLPVQTVLAAAAAILLRVNLPLSVIFAWVTNPITIAPIFLFAYKIGALILGEPALQLHFEFSFKWLSDTYIHIWKPLFLGCFILGSVSAIVGYYTMIYLWRFISIKKWQERKDKRSKK